MSEKTVHGTKVRVVRDDITLLDVDAFVYYAQPDLELGSGLGSAITLRGGPSIKKELDGQGPLGVGDALVSGAGELKAQHIVHAVGPRFQEPEIEDKLRATLSSAFKAAEQAGIKRLALPAMGCGFYGVAPEVSAKVTAEALDAHLGNGARLEEVVICVIDHGELPPFEKHLKNLS